MFGRYGFILFILQLRVISGNNLGECKEFDIKQKDLNKRLKGHSFFETNTDLNDCIRYCMYLSVCKSLNYYMPTEGCELNDVDSLSIKESEFEARPGSVSIDIWEFPSNMAGTCGNRPCSTRQLCVPTDSHQCIDIECESLPFIENGRIELVESERKYLLDKASVVCNSGYVSNQSGIVCKVPEKLDKATCVHEDLTDVKCTIAGKWETAVCLPASLTTAPPPTSVPTTEPPPTSVPTTAPPPTSVPTTAPPPPALPATASSPATALPTTRALPPTTTTATPTGCSIQPGEFTGSLSYTTDGYTCQRWDSQSPHEHDLKHDHLFPDGSTSAAENNCRALGEVFLWCYTTDSSKRWDYCTKPVQVC